MSACIVSISNIRLGFSTYSAGQHCIVYTVYHLRHLLLDILCLHFCALGGANFYKPKKTRHLNGFAAKASRNFFSIFSLVRCQVCAPNRFYVYLISWYCCLK